MKHFIFRGGPLDGATMQLPANTRFFHYHSTTDLSKPNQASPSASHTRGSYARIFDPATGGPVFEQVNHLIP